MDDTSPPLSRQTRIVCVSDTHNASPSSGAFKLPRGDVLIVAGDITNQGSLSELKRTVDWIAKAEFEAKIVIAGNHDITLDRKFYEEHGAYFHNQHPQNPQTCLDLLLEEPSVTYLDHASAEFHLTKPDGPQTHFRVFGSPYSPAHGMWAFGYLPEKAKKLWQDVPLSTDILVTHTPPKYHCDEARGRGAAGCEELRKCLWRVRPKLAVCGHIHEGRGVDRILWDLATPNLRFKEIRSVRWDDPGKDNKKISLLDLTSRSADPLGNDGSTGDRWFNEDLSATYQGLEPEPPWQGDTAASGDNLRGSFEYSIEANSYTETALSDSSLVSPDSAIQDTVPTAIGQGGAPPSGRCDLQALSGRMGRKETCVVNAAIMASNWPHKAAGGKRFNKPIVIDLDLPTWRDDGA